ncbi:MAG: sulfite exporter TauE/SafE family protein [Anaerotignum sp.]|nr:sulfite exporter TauE/SafE family protein [Anaerotignum sp.]
MWVALVGFCSGIISGMGIGGGTILIPALLFLTDITQQQAQGVNLIYFIPTAITALITHQKKGNLDWKTARPIAILGFAGAAAGAFLAVSLESDVLRKVFGGFLFLMGLSEIFKKDKKKDKNKGEKNNAER